MANDSQLRAGEIKDVLLREIERYEDELQSEEIGEVLEVKDGIARIYGLMNAMASEMLEITSSGTGETVTALALNLEEDNIGAVVLGEWNSLHEGDQVRRTGRVLDITVGPGYLGRVVDPLGNPVDGHGPIDGLEGARWQGPAHRVEAPRHEHAPEVVAAGGEGSQLAIRAGNRREPRRVQEAQDAVQHAVRKVGDHAGGAAARTAAAAAAAAAAAVRLRAG